MRSSPGRSYEGRPLPRPDEELVDQGLGFDLVTLLSRRQVLRGLGAGAAALGLAACGGSGGSTPGASGSAARSLEVPDETAGPFPGDGSNGPDVLAEQGVVRSDLRSSFGGMSGTAQGVPVTLELTVQDLARGVPFAGAAVYVWHCDREGRYSLYSEGATDQNYLRGVQVADASGVVRFRSVFPACYPGRWPHVHLEVYPDLASTSDSAGVVSTTQLAFPEDVCREVYAAEGYGSSGGALAQVSLEDDGVFGEDDGAAQLATVTGDVATGYLVRLALGVDTRTTPVVGAGGPPAG